MDILSIAILIFVVMESANVAILYFWPGSRLGNGVGVFNAFHNSENEEQKLATYFWRLHPTIKKLDAMGCITPKGYSKALGWMITGFMAMFTLALAAHILMKVMRV